MPMVHTAVRILPCAHAAYHTLSVDQQWTLHGLSQTALHRKIAVSLVTADVGLARIMDASHMSTGIAPLGTFAYAAPELLMGRRCDEKVSRVTCH